MKNVIVVGIFVALVGCGGGGKGGNTGGAGGTATGTAGATGAAGTTGTGGSSQCTIGSEGCACYGNDSCDGNLQCLSHLCVASSGTGGSATGIGGTTGTGGTATGTGGSATGTGGSAAGTGGSASGAGGTGGSAAGTAGATGAGGSSQCTIGSEGCACYGNDTCNGALKCLSHLCVSLTGTGGSASGTGGSASGTGGSATGTGGSASGTGGSATGTGGGAAGTGGTTGTGGSGTGGTNSNTLTFTGGVVTAGSNTWGITGGVYTFSDGVGSMITPNCSTDTCFGDVTGTGPICVSGIGTRVLLNGTGTSYDYATYWGAAMALDLNNPTNMAMGQMAYVASTHGVKGFQFTFQNRASSVVRLTFKVRDPASGSLVDYCLDLGTTTSIIHFSDAKQECYAAVPGPALTAAMADHVEGLQWQVPTSPAGAVSFDYCISNLTPLTQ